MPFRNRVSRNYREIIKFITQIPAAARHYRTNSLSILWRMFQLFFQNDFKPQEALICGMFAPQIPQNILDGCIGKRGMFHLQAKVNPVKFRFLTEDKSIFYPLCNGLNLPVPKLYAVFSRSTGWSVSGRTLSTRKEWVSFIEEDLPHEFIVKPARGVYGSNIQLYRKESNGFQDGSGAFLSAGQLYARISSHPRFKKFVFQENLRNHRELERLSGTKHLQTLRIVTYMDQEFRGEVFSAILKIIAGSNVVDNYEYGRTGNLLCDVHLGEGSLGPAIKAASAGIGIQTADRHPDTGFKLTGYRVPFWKETLSLAVKAAVLFLPLRTIGWDIAVTEKGPVIVEGNCWYDPSNEPLLFPANECNCPSRTSEVLRLLRRISGR